MSILALHEGQASAAAPGYIPPAKPEPQFSAWGMVTAVPRGIGEAAAQIMGTAADIGNAFAYMRDATPEQRKAMDAGGVPVEQFSSDLGDSLRDRGREFRPDPQTASTAEQLLYGFARGASKIVAGAVAAGPAGVVAAGVEEGVSQADELRRQGVGVDARGAAGAVQGAGLALAALPLVGQTLKATAALYVAGGPGGFIAQQALTREILRNAGHDQIAAQFDPFDPVGLAVASLIPAGFAAWGIRGQRAAAAAKAAEDFRTGPVPSEASPVAAAVRQAYSPEVVDAARVMFATEQRAASNLGDATAHADAHESALSKAEDQMARGEPVQVAATPEVLPMTFARRLDAAILERGYSVESGAASKMSGVPGARKIIIADMPEAEFMAKHGNPVEDVKAHEFAHAFWAGATGLPNFKDPNNRPLLNELRSVSKEFRPAVWESSAAHAKKPEELLADGLAFWLKNPSRRADFPALDKTVRGYDAGGLVRQFPDKEPLPAFADAIDQLRAARSPEPARASEPIQATDAQSATGRPRNLQAVQASIDKAAKDLATVEGALKRGETLYEPEEARTAPANGAAQAAEVDAMQARIQGIQAQRPDLMVQIDGMDAPMRMDDFLAAVKAEADEMAADAPLMEVAAQCALVNGP